MTDGRVDSAEADVPETSRDVQRNMVLVPRRPRPRYDTHGGRRWFGWLMVLLSLAWIGAFGWFVERTVGWLSLDFLLPYEIGGLIAGLTAPVALFLALGALVVRNARARAVLFHLDDQIERLPIRTPMPKQVSASCRSCCANRPRCLKGRWGRPAQAPKRSARFSPSNPTR